MTTESGSLNELLCNNLPDNTGSTYQRKDSSGDDNSTSSQSPPVDGPLMCAGCQGQVCERFFLVAAGQAWHGECLRCSQCHCELQTEPSLYWRDGNIYCQQDYCRLFSVGQCARCSMTIPSSELVMRSGNMTFHPECFSCQECSATLFPGNLYCMDGSSLYCTSHYQVDKTQHTQHTDGERLVKRLRNCLVAMEEGPVCHAKPRLEEMSSEGGPGRQAKRIRTSFRNEQLRALESYFAQKQNPDGKDWAVLSDNTGLPKRVLQVWFQNARAKLRRSLSADKSESAISSFSTQEEVMFTPDISGMQPYNSEVMSTIDQLELSLLTAPIRDTPEMSGSLNYNSQNTPVFSSVEAVDFRVSSDYGDYDEVPYSYYCPFRELR